MIGCNHKTDEEFLHTLCCLLSLLVKNSTGSFDQNASNYYVIQLKSVIEMLVQDKAKQGCYFKPKKHHNAYNIVKTQPDWQNRYESLNYYKGAEKNLVKIKVFTNQTIAIMFYVDSPKKTDHDEFFSFVNVDEMKNSLNESFKKLREYFGGKINKVISFERENQIKLLIEEIFSSEVRSNLKNEEVNEQEKNKSFFKILSESFEKKPEPSRGNKKIYTVFNGFWNGFSLTINRDEFFNVLDINLCSNDKEEGCRENPEEELKFFIEVPTKKNKSIFY